MFSVPIQMHTFLCFYIELLGISGYEMMDVPFE